MTFGRNKLRALAPWALAATCLIGIVYGQLPFREYEGAEYGLGEIPKPPGWEQPAEWIFARLMYPQSPSALAFRNTAMFDWRRGYTSWTIDYPRADRHMVEMVNRLTRINGRGVEQPVSPDDGDDLMNYPWIYTVEPGQWELNAAQVKKLRDYFNRGGFMMFDDFHGLREWEIFMDTMQKVFPDKAVVDLTPDNAVFHTLWDIEDRYQVPGEQFLFSGRTYERDASGMQPHWRGIIGDDGRVMMVICHNMDLGDAVEHSDNPSYPAKYSAQAMRMFLNFLVYSMSH